MGVNIEVSEKYIESFIKFNKERVKELESKIQDLKSEMNEVLAIIDKVSDKKSYNGKQSVSHLHEKETTYMIDYKSNFVWWEKLEYVIRKKGAAMTSYDIFEEIKSHEPGKYDDVKSYKSGYKSLTSVLSTKSKEGDLIKSYRDKEVGKNKFGLAEWFNGYIIKDDYK